MKVHELIAELQKAPSDREVAVRGGGNICLLTVVRPSEDLCYQDDMDYEWLEYPEEIDDDSEPQTYVLLDSD